MNLRTLLHIDAAHCIAVVSTMGSVVRDIDKLSGGVYLPAVAKWEATRNSDHPDWTAFHVMTDTRTLYMDTARAHIEAAPPVFIPAPIRQHGHLVGIGATETPGGTDPEYVWYWYLEYPPLANGDVRAVTLEDHTIGYTYGEDRTVSRAIKVNQVGYLPDGPKVAMVGCHLYGLGPLAVDARQFHVCDAESAEVLYTGDIVLRDADSRGKSGRSLTGEYVYECDFSELGAAGNVYIRVPGVGRSWIFRVAEDAYGEAAWTAFRGLYHHRCGTQIKGGWPRGYCHTKPIGESEHVCWPASFRDRPREYNRFDAIGATTDMSNATPKMSGGWHDAADWDRNNAHYTNIFDLLYAYELRPGAFADKQFTIPESANGVPDVLDEAAWGLQVWMKSMAPDGGVSGMIETWTHPAMDADVDYVFSRRTRWDSLLFAGAAAMLAQHMAPFNLKRAAKWLAFAVKAYGFGNNPANSLGTVTINARADRGKGAPYTVTWTETDAHIAPFLMHARARLHRATGDFAYLKGIEDLPVLKPCLSPYSFMDYSPWLLYGSLPYVTSTAQRLLLDLADRIMAFRAANPYGVTWETARDYWLGWGESCLTNRARLLFLAHHITGRQDYRDAAIRNTDFMLGANPMGMSWTTGIGSVYPAVIQHEISATDGIADPVPGITLYGVTGGMYRDLVALAPAQETPVWRCWSPHPTKNTGQCEYTIHETNSSTIFCCLMLLAEGWQPPSNAIMRQPRRETALHGRYFLP